MQNLPLQCFHRVWIEDALSYQIFSGFGSRIAVAQSQQSASASLCVLGEQRGRRFHNWDSPPVLSRRIAKPISTVAHWSTPGSGCATTELSLLLACLPFPAGLTLSRPFVAAENLALPSSSPIGAPSRLPLPQPTSTMTRAMGSSWGAASWDRPHASERWVRGFPKLANIPSVGEQRGRKQGYRVRSSAGEEESPDATESSSTVNNDFGIADTEGGIFDVRENPSSELQLFAQGMAPKMSRRAAVWNSMAILGVGGGVCSCCNAAAMAGAPDWSYDGDTKWGGTCAIGARQSPIDVRINQALHGEALGELQFDYKLCIPTFKNPGHGTMQVNFPEGVNKLRVKGRELNLVQFHFHTPSEHAFDGLRFPMEAHLVHQDVVTKAYAVVGVMLDAAPDAYSNGALAAALRYSPLEHGKTLTLSNVQVSANDLLPPRVNKDDRHYIHYLGSFTTPPCTESVDWFLLEKPLRVSTSEVLEFLKFVGDEQTLGFNARPIQPHGDREIFEGP